MQFHQRLRAALIGGLGAVVALPAMAQTPQPWQLGFQPPQSAVMHGIEGLHSLVLWLMTMVTVFVALLLVYCVWRFRASRNPTPSRTSHHTALEVAWTLLPVLILVLIAIPSFRLVYFEDRTSDPGITIKVTGHQWNWEYGYPDNGGFSFISNMILDEDLKPGDLRHLAVDNHMVVPAGTNVRILTTSADVIHSFFIPSLGVQRYAIPGRTIETWVRVDKPGIYYGECNQICGTNHSVMPIAVEALSAEDFTKWAAQAKTKFASVMPRTLGDGERELASVAEPAR
ncbi:MAG: cytochrome c oxidase subunit II [Pseudomonadota bacterium]|nr:cytochrome c oxidase subunit II [Pseudomonadota bacterium]